MSLEEKHENFIGAVRKSEMLAAEPLPKWKWAAVKKVKANRNTSKKNLVSTYDNSYIKNNV